MISLQTPFTGYPDLEVKIAYGLARVGAEAIGTERVTIKNRGGYYEVQIDASENKFELLEKTFSMLCQRMLSSEVLPFMTPGVGTRSAAKIKAGEKESFSLKIYRNRNFLLENRKTQNVCRHNNKSVGNILGFTASTSYHNRRDGIDVVLTPRNTKDKTSPKITRRPTNPRNICKTCGLLSLLGSWFSSFMFRTIDKEVMVVPIPKKTATGEVLRQILASHHLLRKEWIARRVPEKVMPLIILTRIPSTAYFLKGFDFFLSFMSGGGNRGYHVDGISSVPLDSYLKFIDANPYNVASVHNLLRGECYEGLQILNELIVYRRVDLLGRFCKVYSSRTSTPNSKYASLLYGETARYLLREVAMISPEIIDNKSLASLARTLRYFVRDRKYCYADDIRNARKDSRDFENTIAKMLREARLRLEQDEKIHLPNEKEVREVFRLANDSFEEVKTALAILAFSFPYSAEKV